MYNLIQLETKNEKLWVQCWALLEKFTPQNKSSAVAVATKDIGQKDGEGAAVPLSRELGPCLVQCGLHGARSTSVPSGVFIHPATIDMGQKLGGVGWVCPFFWG